MEGVYNKNNKNKYSTNGGSSGTLTPERHARPAARKRASNTRRSTRTASLRGQDDEEAVAVLRPARRAPWLGAVAIRHLTARARAPVARTFPPPSRPAVSSILAGVALLAYDLIAEPLLRLWLA